MWPRVERRDGEAVRRATRGKRPPLEFRPGGAKEVLRRVTRSLTRVPLRTNVAAPPRFADLGIGHRAAPPPLQGGTNLRHLPTSSAGPPGGGLRSTRGYNPSPRWGEDPAALRRAGSSRRMLKYVAGLPPGGTGGLPWPVRTSRPSEPRAVAQAWLAVRANDRSKCVAQPHSAVQKRSEPATQIQTNVRPSGGGWPMPLSGERSCVLLSRGERP
jgi:hypothetical protein